MTQPNDQAYTDVPIDDYEEVNIPGSPRWFLNRLVIRLLNRQERYDKLERYALGNHPFPNGDSRFVVQLRDLQKKARTNYVELVITAVTDRMQVKGFRIGDGDTADEDATQIWKFNDMDLQSSMVLNMGATFGDTYISVTAPEPGDPFNPLQLPIITAEDPRECIVETDPARPTVTICALKMWQDDIAEKVYAIIDDGEQYYEYEGPAVTDVIGMDTATLTRRLLSSPQEGGFQLVAIYPNNLGEVSFVRGNWQPAFGTMGRAEAESVFHIQDRINHTVLDRLVISKNQAYNQRWITGANPKGAGKDGRPPFRPGADAVWATGDADSKFGQFEAADLTGILEAIREDVGDMAAISKTPGTYLMNRMVNVSGDTLTQDQVALVQKVKDRMTAMGWMYQKVMRLCFLATGDTGKAQEVDIQTLWVDPEVRALSELADAASKLVTAGIPLPLFMEKYMNATPDEINMAVQEQQRQEQLMMQQQQMALDAAAQSQDSQQSADSQSQKSDQQHESQMADKNNQAKLQQVKASAAAKPKPKPAAKKPTK